MKAHLVYAVLRASSLMTPVFAAPERGWLAPEFKDRYENRFWLWEFATGAKAKQTQKNREIASTATVHREQVDALG
jgi:hypothetical protein